MQQHIEDHKKVKSISKVM